MNKPRYFTYFNCLTSGINIVEGIRPEGKCSSCKEVIIMGEIADPKTVADKNSGR